MCVCVSKFENFSAFLATAIPTVSTPAQHRQVLLLLRKKEVQFNVMGWKADTGSRVKIQEFWSRIRISEPDGNGKDVPASFPVKIRHTHSQDSLAFCEC